MKTLLIIFILITYSDVFSQTFNKFGVKGGLIFNGISTENDENDIIAQSGFFSLLSYDIGIYGEFFNTDQFCLSSELHFTVRGERNPNYLGVVEIINPQKEIYEFEYMSDRFYYFSLQLLPRYRFVITPSNENIYIFGGPRFDLLVSNSNSGNLNNVREIKNGHLEIGAVLGMGIEIWDVFSFEFRFEHLFTPVYSFSYNGNNIIRQHNAILFLTGINLKKILKI